MLLQASDHSSSGLFSVQEICNHILTEYHAPILRSCNVIRTYLQQHTPISELPETVSEIVPLVFQKIEDELTHTFRKETGIVFPRIQQIQTSKDTGLQPKVLETMLTTQQTLIQLLQKLRQLMHNYITRPDWPASLRACINEMFLLETYVLRWVHFEQSSLYPQLNSISKANHNE